MKTLIAISGELSKAGNNVNKQHLCDFQVWKNTTTCIVYSAHDESDQGYAKRFKQYYRSLGCQVEALRLLHTKLSNEEIYKKFRSQDMIYLGAGDTVFLMKQLEQKAGFAFKGAIPAGDESLSAGSVPQGRMLSLNMATATSHQTHLNL